MPTVLVCKVSWDHDYSTNAGYFIQWSQVWKRNELIILFPKWRFLFFYTRIESLTLYHYLSIFSIKITDHSTTVKSKHSSGFVWMSFGWLLWMTLPHKHFFKTNRMFSKAVVVLFSDWKLACITAISGDQGDFLCGILRYWETSNRL